MQLTPVIAIHMTAALAALAIGPVALWAHKGRVQRTHLHRAAGYAWVTLMLATALSALFIRDYLQFDIAGYTWIHLFVPLTLAWPSSTQANTKAKMGSTFMMAELPTTPSLGSTVNMMVKAVPYKKVNEPKPHHPAVAVGQCKPPCVNATKAASTPTVDMVVKGVPVGMVVDL